MSYETKKIKHNLTDELVCPYCGAIFSDSDEICSGEEDIGEVDCGECEAVFLAIRNISVTYSSKKMESIPLFLRR